MKFKGISEGRHNTSRFSVYSADGVIIGSVWFCLGETEVTFLDGSTVWNRATPTFADAKAFFKVSYKKLAK